MDALIAAATDRAHPRELAGEEAAVAAFREVHRRSAGSAAGNRRPVRVPGLLAGSLAAKIALSLGVLSLGGIAFAAETGSLPSSAQSAAHRVFRAVGVPDADQRASDKGGQPTQTHSGGQQAGATSPAVTGLCRAYASGNKDEHGQAMDSTAFQALATAAGGEDKIEAFCAGVLATPSAGPSTIPSSSPSATPGHAQTDPEPTTASPPENGDDQGNPPNPTHPTGPPTDLATPTNVGKP